MRPTRSTGAGVRILHRCARAVERRHWSGAAGAEILDTTHEADVRAPPLCSSARVSGRAARRRSPGEGPGRGVEKRGLIVSDVKAFPLPALSFCRSPRCVLDRSTDQFIFS